MCVLPILGGFRTNTKEISQFGICRAAFAKDAGFFGRRFTTRAQLPSKYFIFLLVPLVSSVAVRFSVRKFRSGLRKLRSGDFRLLPTRPLSGASILSHFGRSRFSMNSRQALEPSRVRART